MKRKKILIIVLSIFMTISVAVTASVINRTKNNKENIMEGTGTNSKTLIEQVSVDYDKDDYYFNWKNESYSTIDLSKVLNNITKSGVYEITGTLKNGSLIVDVDKKSDNGTVFLVLNGANISSETSAPIYIKNSEKVVLIIENGTENTIYQASNITVDENQEPSSAIFSKADLTITGSGKLTVTSNYNDCITSKDKLKITDGNLVLNAKSDGIIGKDLLSVEKANITIVAEKYGMRATNENEEKMGNLVISDGTFNITSNNDGIYAYSLLQIDGDTFNVTTGGGYVKSTNVNTDANTGASMVRPPMDEKKNTETETESKKGLKASGRIIIKDGEFNISSFDDSIHSNGDVNKPVER